MEYITAIVKKVRPFVSILIFFGVFTVVFMLVSGTINFQYPLSIRSAFQTIVRGIAA